MRNRFEIRGEETVVFIRRRDGTVLETLIDTADLPIIQSAPQSWHARWNPDTQSFYAQTIIPTKGGRKTVQMSRLLTLAPANLVVDHRNYDTMDNRRHNLRICTDSENKQNKRGAYCRNNTGVRGVWWNSKTGKFHAHIQVDNKRRDLGRYDTLDEAAAVAAAHRAVYMPCSAEADDEQLRQSFRPVSRKMPACVSWHKRTGKWQVRVEGCYVGLFQTRAEADAAVEDFRSRQTDLSA